MRQTKGLAYRAKRAERSDMMWGACLAIGIPIIVLFVYQVWDPYGISERTFEKNLGGQLQLKKAPPMSTAHAAAVVAQMERLYKENYQTILRPVLDRDDLSTQERINTFNCLNKVYNKCLFLLNKLKKDLERKDTQIAGFKDRVQQWTQALENAGKEVARLDPIKGR